MSRSGITLLDGGMGRELKRMGAPFRQPEWSALALMESPESVSKAHNHFIAAGADVITTSNYAVVPFHLGREQFEQRGVELTSLAGDLAWAEADKANQMVQSSPVRVAGSIPPLYGSYRPDLFEAESVFRDLTPLIAALAPTVDFWLAETISSIAEFQSVQSVLKQEASSASLPLWVSFTLRDDEVDVEDNKPATIQAQAFLRSGESVADAVVAASKAGVEAILFNCSQPEIITAGVLEAARELQTSSAIHQSAGNGLRLGAYANAFTPRSEQAQANADSADLRQELDQARYLEFVQAWVAAGATIVGGCCGIGPEYIATIRQWLDDHSGSDAEG